MRRQIVGIRGFILSIGLLLNGCAPPGLERAEGPKKYQGLYDKMMEKNVPPTRGSDGTKQRVAQSGGADEYNKYDTETDPEMKRVERNRIIASLVAIDDYDFQMYSSKAALMQRGSATVADITVLALTSAAAVTGGEESKSILSAVAAVITGSRVVVDRDVFYASTLPVLLDRMQALRLKKRAEIFANFSRSDADYPLSAGVTDFFDYFRDGTLSAAISDISKDTANKASEPTLKDEIEKFAKSYSGTFALKGTDGKLYDFTVADASWDDASQTLNLALKTGDSAAAKLVKLDGMSKDAAEARDVLTTLRSTVAFTGLSTTARAALLTAHIKLAPPTTPKAGDPGA